MARWISKYASLARHSLVREHAARAGVSFGSAAAGQDSDRAGDECIGWGYKASGQWAKAEAARRGGLFRLFEDGFVRSLRPGYGRGALYSLVEDRSGIYYDGSGASDLARGLNGEGAIGASLDGNGWQVEAAEDLRRYREIGASKYNWFPGEFEADALDRVMPERGVLVVDQTRGDAANRYGEAGSSEFEAMLAAALEENPGATVYVRGHPDHVFRAKRSCLKGRLLADASVRMLDARLAPRQVFERVERVYVATSLLGLEAMIHGVPVSVFGCPFYAGWGCSDDRNLRLPRRTRERTVAEIFEAAYRCYSHYFDPDTLEPCSLARILDHLALQKSFFRENARTWIAFRMAPWRRGHLDGYFASPAGRLRYTGSRRRLRRWTAGDEDARVLVWGKRDLDGAPQAWRIEDGFLRSAGLGAEFHTPLSLVLDGAGIYYDSTSRCDLEAFLEEHVFTEEERREAKNLAGLLVAKALTKYNLQGESATAAWPEGGAGRVRILVPGQVETDASIRYGSPQWQSNLELLKEVRRRNPEAVIAFKPHPDVVRRLRPGKALTAEIEELCDKVVRELDILPWIESCDEVHTLTSLSGFEALLRGKEVCCYGAPFYAGWGLTKDVVAVERRSRRLELEELVAGALLVYPRYVNPLTGEFTTAFGAVDLIGSKAGALGARSGHLRAIVRLKTLLRSR